MPLVSIELCRLHELFCMRKIYNVHACRKTRIMLHNLLLLCNVQRFYRWDKLKQLQGVTKWQIYWVVTGRPWHHKLHKKLLHVTVPWIWRKKTFFLILHLQPSPGNLVWLQTVQAQCSLWTFPAKPNIFSWIWKYIHSTWTRKSYFAFHNEFCLALKVFVQ